MNAPEKIYAQSFRQSGPDILVAGLNRKAFESDPLKYQGVSGRGNVFCGTCKWHYNCGFDGDFCKNPKNIRHEKTCIKATKSSPYCIEFNAKNDCPDYEEKRPFLKRLRAMMFSVEKK